MPQQVLRVYQGGDPSINFQFQKHLFQTDEQVNPHGHLNPFVHGDTHLHTDQSFGGGAHNAENNDQQILAQSIDHQVSQDLTLLNNASSLSPGKDATRAVSTLENNNQPSNRLNQQS